MVSLLAFGTVRFSEAAVVLNEVDQSCRQLSYEALNQHRSELTAEHRITILALHAIPEVERVASWIWNWNDSVHPARAMKVSISKAPYRGLGCNGWFCDH